MPHSERLDVREQRRIGIPFRVKLGALCTTELVEPVSKQDSSPKSPTTREEEQ
jgi:hypothetical protein